LVDSMSDDLSRDIHLAGPSSSATNGEQSSTSQTITPNRTSKIGSTSSGGNNNPATRSPQRVRFNIDDRWIPRNDILSPNRGANSYTSLGIDGLVKALSLTRQEIKRRQKARDYSVPALKHAVKLAWPLDQTQENSTMGSPPGTFLEFDILTDPKLSLEKAQDGLFVMINGERSQDVLVSFLLQKFSPDHEFERLVMKFDELESLGITIDETVSWDVVIKRSEAEGIRVIDVFQGIFNTYNTAVTAKEFRLNDTEFGTDLSLLNARHRRAKAPEKYRNEDRYRVDLLGSKTRFNGIFYDAEFNQYRFRLKDREPKGPFGFRSF
ncbi:hypothetical protein H0H92_012400, partial [Tricholoma furcatifolium]